MTTSSKARERPTSSAALNWILRLIVAFLSAALADYLVTAVYDALDGTPGRIAPGPAQNMTSAFAPGLAFTLGATVISSEPRRVALAMCAISLLRPLPIVYSLIAHPYMRARAGSMAGPVAAGVLGNAAALLLVRWWTDRDAKTRRG